MYDVRQPRKVASKEGADERDSHVCGGHDGNGTFAQLSRRSVVSAAHTDACGAVAVSVPRSVVAGVREDDDITELDVEILRAIAAGQLPGAGLLTLELRRLEALGLLDVSDGAAHLNRRGAHAIEIANGECAAG